ncbi:ABC transporter ATP-binding protein [Lactiplantibacillus plantarum]|uniref:ABC transporter ATP-binding protein n=1 Tax=Lactiplantibacillus plantarum TaxID=1590 RepID=UPI0021F7A5C3|nr:ABC transporter ATP-binding protein [Lactiplantibacillus plantarum]MCW0154665.1 ABC transporter ATP-binding protein [Lactiplantibacillus plantarum]
MSKQLVLKHITKTYTDGKYDKKVLDNVSLTVDTGDFISIIGESGSGKSTLLNILSLIDNKFEGSYMLDDQDVKNLSDPQLSRLRKEKIGFIFQDFLLLPNLTVRENICLQQEYLSKKQLDHVSNEYINYLLKSVGLTNYSNSYPEQLSGGQKQRVAIARSLLNRADIIVADEPTGALDKTTGTSILKLLKEFNNVGKTIIMVTHDLAMAHYANHTFKIDSEGVSTV